MSAAAVYWLHRLHNVFTRRCGEGMLSCFHACVYIAGACAVMWRIPPRSWEAIYHFWMIGMCVCRVWNVEKLPAWPMGKTALANWSDTGDMRVCNVIMCVWSPSSLRLLCLVIWVHLWLCYISRHSVNFKSTSGVCCCFSSCRTAELWTLLIKVSSN